MFFFFLCRLKLREVQRETIAVFLFFSFPFFVEIQNREEGEFERKLLLFSVVTERQREKKQELLLTEKKTKRIESFMNSSLYRTERVRVKREISLQL